MKRFLGTATALIALASLSSAQALKDYVQLRKKYGIVESVNVAALETLIGTRVCEVQGIVKGSFRADAKTSLLLEKTDGQTMVVDAEAVPEWLVGSEIPARLIVRANRDDSDAPIHASLLGAAKEEDVHPIEQAMIAAVAKSATTKHRVTQTSSRHKGYSRFADGIKPATKIWTLPADDATPYYAAFVKKDNPRLGDREATRIAQGVIGFSRKYGVDARLIMAMVCCESDFNPREVSNKGAMGLGQLMPETVSEYGISNPFDSVENLYGTVREIRSHLDKYRAETGDEFQAMVLGLAAYNAGEGAVKRHGGVPPYRETQGYVRKLIKLYYKLCGRA